MSITLNGTTGIIADSPATVKANAFLDAAGGNTATINGKLPIALADIATGSAPIYACRAWVNFNGTGTIAIRASGNVTSITDNATGDYTINFTTALSDANYALVTGEQTAASGGSLYGNIVSIAQVASALTTTTARIVGGPQDHTIVTVAIIR